MGIKIYTSRYKDQTAVTIESKKIRAQFLPAIGAKLSSLFYKPIKYELLVQRPGIKYLLQPFDGDYVAGECSGMDDMFPTIDVCFCDQPPWEGIKMADHGEVWSLNWDQGVDGGRLHFGINGVRFPYRLEKWVSFTTPEILRIDYQLTNLSAFDFDFLWAAHAMINIEADTELVLPMGVSGIVHTFCLGGNFGKYGDEYSWPEATLPDGSRIDFRKLRPKSTGQAYKYYVKDQLPAGWCGLKYKTRDFSLAFSFPVKQVPYLGVLPNEGGWQDLYNIFLEPCTATFDRPDVARYRQEISTVQANSTYQWHMNITLAEGIGFTGVGENGVLEER